MTREMSEYMDPDEFNSKTNDYINSTSHFHLNCRSLSSNWESFKSLICELHCNTFSFDYIGISEVFSCERDARLSLPGYHELITKTRNDDTHGGVGLFIKENINYKIRDDLSGFIPHVFDSLFIAIVSADEHNNQVTQLLE